MTTLARVAIRLATPVDARTLAPFAERVFRATFERDPHHRPDDMAIYTAEHFSVARMERELSDEAAPYLLAELDGALLGYVKLGEDPPPACVRARRAMELIRLYVDPSVHGQGVAQALMSASMRYAVERGCDVMWLGVWRNNHRARRFYEKCGFRHVGEHPFQFGSALQADEVYFRSVDELSTGAVAGASAS